MDQMRLFWYPVLRSTGGGGRLQSRQMKRRGFIIFFVGILWWPLAVEAQETAAPGIPKEAAPDPVFARAIAAVNGKLKGPQSARYSDMVRKTGPDLNGKPAEVVCGSVSAEGYGANRPFVYFIADGAAFLVNARPQPEDVAQMIYGRFCK